MPLTVRVEINGTDVEVLTVSNIGEVPGDRGLHRYVWRSKDGGSGTVMHRRREGAADLAARVLVDLTAKRRRSLPPTPTRPRLPPSLSGDRTL